MLGKTIKSLLANSATLTNLVGTNIYPYVITENTTLPAICYVIDTLSPVYSKAGWEHDEMEFSIHSFAKDYSALQDVVQAVRTALELKTTGYGTQEIGQIRLTAQREGFEIDYEFFYNELDFKVTVNKY